MSVCLGSIKFCALRATRLDNLGNVAAGPNNYWVTEDLIQMTVAGDTDAGKDIFVRGGCDQALISYKSPELTKRYNLTLDQAKIDSGLESMILGGAAITSGSDVVGFEWPLYDCESDGTPPLVAIEAWSYAWDCDAQDGTWPYWYWLWPMTQWTKKRAETLQADANQQLLDAFTRRNPLWGHGPYGGSHDWSNGAGGRVLVTEAPPAGVCGYGTVVPSS